MEKFVELYPNIYRLSVPFESVLTSVFAVVVDGNCIIIDAATTESDVNNYILPAIKDAGFNVTKILISHEHGDHAGGLGFLVPHFPEADVAMFDMRVAEKIGRGRLLADGEVFYDVIKILHLPGHSPDSLGVLDTRSGVLLTFDSLQLFGIGKYVTYVYNEDVYKSSIEKIKSEKINDIATAHDYAPLGYFASGEKEIKHYLDMCVDALDYIKDFLNAGGERKAETIAEAYLAEK